MPLATTCYSDTGDTSDIGELMQILLASSNLQKEHH